VEENNMSLKKELLDELTEKQLKELAENVGVKITLSRAEKRYYADWGEKDKLVDIMGDKESLTISDIEDYLKLLKDK
jgi:hypothetical protein